MVSRGREGRGKIVRDVVEIVDPRCAVVLAGQGVALVALADELRYESRASLW